MNRACGVFVVTLAGLAGAGLAGACQPLTLDPFLYSPLAAPAEGYQLSTAVIPRFEDLFVDTPDGQRLHVVFVPADAATPDPMTIVYLHGQSSNIGTSWPRIEYLYRTGQAVYAVDPRGYGRSTGTPTEAGLQTDLQAVYRFLIDQRGLVPSRLVYYGRSLGGAFAIYLASVAPPAALITESAFTSIAALVRDGAYADLPRGFVSDSVWDSVGRIRGIRAPYLILHGTADDYVQFRYAGELAAAHPAHHELVAVPGANHINVPQVMGLPAYAARIRSFLENEATIAK
jgi:pimeloyl-ACP methyl ester carboxylesterase